MKYLPAGAGSSFLQTLVQCPELAPRKPQTHAHQKGKSEGSCQGATRQTRSKKSQTLRARLAKRPYHSPTCGDRRPPSPERFAARQLRPGAVQREIKIGDGEVGGGGERGDVR